MAGWGLGAWGAIPWGLGGGGVGGGGVGALSPSIVPDEGGVRITITGAWRASTYAIVTISDLVATAVCPQPRAIGGVDAAGGGPGTGAYPVASSDGTTIECVVPQAPVGLYTVLIEQPGMPLVTLPNALTVVRRDWWTRLHSLRRKFPSPPYPAVAVGAKALARESWAWPDVGEHTPGLEGMLHALAGGLLATDSYVYTRLAPPPFASGATATVVSSAAGDNTQTITIVGLDVNGGEQTEAIALAGLVPQVGARTWSEIHSASLDASAVGVVTVSDGLATAPEAIDIRPGFLEKSSGALQPGDTEIVVEGNYRFPGVGQLFLAGERIAYTAKTTSIPFNSFTVAAVTDLHPVWATVADGTRMTASLHLARAAMLLDYAEGAYIDAIARRFGGFPRLAGMADDEYRGVVAGSCGARRGFLAGLERLLAELYASPPEIIEDLVTFSETVVAGEVVRTPAPGAGYPCVVWIAVPLVLIGATYLGRTYLCGGEPQATTGAFTVDTTYPIVLPYGVYLDPDTARVDNYMDMLWPGDASVLAVGLGVTVDSAADNFLATDVGHDLVISGAARAASNGPWEIETFTGVGRVNVRGRLQQEGRVDGATLTIFEINTNVPWEACPFGPDSVGREIQVEAVGDDPGVLWGGVPLFREIIRYIDRRSVEVNAVWPGAGGDMSWRFMPNFSFQIAIDWRAPRATFAGSTITLPRTPGAPPIDVLVDYTTVPSAQLLLDTTERNQPAWSSWPFYLDGTMTWMADLFDEFVPAGVAVRFGDPHS